MLTIILIEILVLTLTFGQMLCWSKVRKFEEGKQRKLFTYMRPLYYLRFEILRAFLTLHVHD